MSVTDSSASFSLRLARNSFFYFCSQIAGKGLLFLITVYLARVLGASDYGKFAFSFGLVTLFSVLSKFGLDLLTSRDVGEDPQRASQYLPASLTLRFLLSLLFLVLIVAAILLLNRTAEINRLIILLAISAALQSMAGAGTSLFEALQWFGYRSLLNVCMYGFILVAIVALTHSNPALNRIGPAFLVGAIIYFLLTLGLSHFKIARFRPSFDSAFLWHLFKMALPLGLTEIFIGIYYRVDTVLLSLFDTDAVVGWYDAAYTFVYVLRLLPVTVAMVLLPGLSSLYAKTPEKGVHVYRVTLYYSIAVGFLITFLIAVSSPLLVSLVYGAGYAPSANVLKLLIWTCVIMFANAFQGILLVITGQRTAFFRATALGAISNLLLNLVLIPRWSMYGAAVTTVLSEFFVFLVSAASLRKLVPFGDFFQFTIGPVIGTAFMVLWWLYFGRTHFILGILSCGLIYVLTFFAMRIFYAEDGSSL